MISLTDKSLTNLDRISHIKHPKRVLKEDLLLTFLVPVPDTLKGVRYRHKEC